MPNRGAVTRRFQYPTIIATMLAYPLRVAYRSHGRGVRCSSHRSAAPSGSNLFLTHQHARKVRTPPIGACSRTYRASGGRMRPITQALIVVFGAALSACSTVGGTLPVASADTGRSASTTSSVVISNGQQQQTELKDLMGCNGSLKYLPVPDFQAPDYTYVTLADNGKPEIKKGTFPTDDNRRVNELLPNLAMDVSVEEIEGGGKVAFFGTSVFHRRIVMDFMKSRTEPIVDQSGSFYGFGRVGAGLRLRIELWTTDSSFDGSLIGLAASAKAKTASGHISAQTIGVNNSDVTLSMPFNADFSEGSIQKIIEALAVIKSRLHDEENTTLVPHFLARISCVKT